MIRILKILGIVILTIFFVEAFFQLGFLYNRSYNEVYKDIGRGRKAGMNYVMFNEGFSISKFNAERYLGPGYKKEKEQGVYRIVLIGDSFVEGFQVKPKEHFRTLLEKKLNNKSSRKYEVLNFGRSGFNANTEYAYSSIFIDKYNPDIKIYIVSGADFIDSYSDPIRVYTFSNEKDELFFALKDSTYLLKNEQLLSLMSYSSLLNLMSNNFKILKSDQLFSILFGKFFQPAINSNNQSKPIVLSKTMEIIIDQIRKDSSTLIATRDVEAYNIIKGKYPENKIIKLHTELNSSDSSMLNYNFWKITNKYGHWNYAGHEKVSELLYDFLEDKHYLKSE
jgi:hypothetical protein